MNRPITVLFTITDLARDGAQRQLFELVKGLDRKRFKPLLLTLTPGGPMMNDFKDIPDLEIISVRKMGKYDLSCLFRIYNYLRKRKVDVIQPFLTPATFFSLMPAIWDRVPLIIVTERSAPGRSDINFGHRLYLITEDLLSRFADWAIPNSEAGKRYLIQRGMNPRRIKVIYNGINLERLKVEKEKVEQVRAEFHLDRESKIVGMMARFFPLKNHFLFLEAASIVSREIPYARFALLGDGPLRKELEELSLKLGIRSKTIFFGEQRDVATCLSTFDIAVLTSDSEGCSNSLLEAMILGKPVVATNVGGNRELIHPGETGFLVPTGSARAIADTIISLLKNEGLAMAIGQRAREWSTTNFSVSKMVQEYQSLYEESLTKKLVFSKTSQK